MRVRAEHVPSRRRLSVLSACLSLAILPALAPAGKPATQDPSPTRLQDAIPGTIRVDVSLITVPVIVTDKNGESVDGLTRRDFRLFEDDAAQTIDRLVPPADPFDVALMIDSSGSTRFRFEDIQQGAIAFSDELRPQDRLMVLSFDTGVTMHTGFTNDRGQIREAVMQTRPSSARTRLYDALGAVMSAHLETLHGRKALIIFTDGVDNASVRLDSGQVLKAIERSDVVAYAIQYDTREDGMPDRMSVPLPQGYVSFDKLYARGVKFLNDLTRRSGARRFQADTLDSLRLAFADIAQEIPRQYTLCYYTSKKSKAGSFHRIRVTVNRPGVAIRTRPGYRTR